MSFFRRIGDFFQKPPANTINFSEAEKAFRWQQLQQDPGPFTYTEEGFICQSEDRSETVKWADIDRVVAFKLDRFISDLICIRIYWQGRELFISEDDPGWYQFFDRLNGALPVARNWETHVVQPPFATNEIIVYQK